MLPGPISTLGKNNRLPSFFAAALLAVLGLLISSSSEPTASADEVSRTFEVLGFSSLSL